MSKPINTFNEKPLHAALKDWYARPGDLLEVDVDGYVIDLVRDGLLVEIQTANFSAIRRKLGVLCKTHRVHLVHPLTRRKWIVRTADAGKTILGRRKSPKEGTVVDIFAEAVYAPNLLMDGNLSLEVVLVDEEEIRRKGKGRRGWRRGGWVIEERRLLEVVEARRFETAADFGSLVPDDLPVPFTTAQLAEALAIRRRLAQQACYALRHMGAIESVGKEGNAVLYRKTQDSR